MAGENSTFDRRLLRLIGLSSVISIILLVVFLAVPITMLTIGMTFQNSTNCPLQPRMSLFLIVSGSSIMTWILLTITISILAMTIYGKKPLLAATLVVCIGILILPMILFHFIWSIIGSVWTFGVKGQVQHTDSSKSTFCHRTLYDFTFVYLIIMWTIFAVHGCRRSFYKSSNIEL